VLIWDVDDVLNHFTRTWCDEWWCPRHAGPPRSYADLTENPPDAVLGVSRDIYLASIDAFREARFASLVPCAEALAWFSEHGDRCRHVALTAMPRAFAHLSAEWVIRNFGRWIRTFAFVPSARDGAAADRQWISKSDYIEWLRQGDVFIDDREENVERARRLGMHGVVVPQPWNDSSDTSLTIALSKVTAAL